ncbi:disulfide isomerase plus ER retention motif [Cryptosporidium sp. chipmunk genotype I]|uniref:disulfide isomerase plus ER retention motif n=1 Tax=Cryptosporidium sp. chipmunk genotype I TaxID=1280935 RepID=UPI00351A8F3B|nr:disulfide isomerase plus ER retention motif [Cryptosporidium sp. chipmunk genotype I]
MNYILLLHTAYLILTGISFGFGEELRLTNSNSFGTNVSNSTKTLLVSNSTNDIPSTTNFTTKTTTAALSTLMITNTIIKNNKSNDNNTGFQLTTPGPKFGNNLSNFNPVANSESLVKQLGLEDLSELTKMDSVVLFYVPWCVYCRGIMPEFEKVANIFKGKKINFGKIDCNEHRKVALLEQVMRFPTIKIYSEGQSQYYSGLPNSVSIINFVNSEFNRDIFISDLSVLEVFINTDGNSMKVVAIIDHEKKEDESVTMSPVSSSYTKLSHKYHNIFFAHTLINNTEVLNFIKSYSSKDKDKSKNVNHSNLIKENTLAIFTPWDDDSNELYDFEKKKLNDKHGLILIDKVDFNNFESLEKQILKYQYPLITEFNPLIAQKLFLSEKTISFLFVNNEVPNLKLIMERYRKIASQFRGEILFIKSGTNLAHERRIAQVLIQDECSLPCISIIKFPSFDEGKMIAPTLPNMPPMKRPQAPLVYRCQFSGSDLLKDLNLERFIQDFASGRLNPYFKSEEPPSEEDNDGPVRIVVSKTFKKEVIESNLDVLIVFYAPWCGHCRKLEPDYNVLAQRLRGINDKLKIAKIDGSQNEVENIQILGYPSILLFKSGMKTEPILYNGDRSVANMIEWISKNASFKFDHLHYLNPELAFEDDDLDMAFSHEL